LSNAVHALGKRGSAMKLFSAGFSADNLPVAIVDHVFTA
jgi:hypothetical protein